MLVGDLCVEVVDVVVVVVDCDDLCVVGVGGEYFLFFEVVWDQHVGG